MKSFNVIVIGAGAAGLMCAGQAVQRGRSVLVLEHTAKIGEKIRISGGGRCNFTNLGCAPHNFISRNPHFCKSALSRYTAQDFIALVNRYGIAWHEKKLGQLFCDESAEQIIAMLRAECGDADIQTDTTITDISRVDDEYLIKTTRGDFSCQSLVVATGGLSIPKIGASPFGYEVAKQFGLPVVEPRAALVPLTFDVDVLSVTRDLSGVAVDPVTISCNGTNFNEALLFTHKGVSGPAVLQISSYWSGGDDVVINLTPGVDINAVLKESRARSPRKMLRTVLGDILPLRLAERIAEQSGCDGPVADLSDQKIAHVAARVSHWAVRPSGSEGYRTAEVTLGGVDTTALSSKTFEAKSTPGLYFIGEVVDVTGWLGGYNFQWAWSSGWACGQVV